jgi:hypothetical protein
MRRFSAWWLVLSCGAEPTGPLEPIVPSCTDCTIESCGFEAEGPDDEEIRLANARGDVEVLAVRRLAGQGSGRSSIYELRGLALEVDGHVDCFSSGLDYENSHHNWADRALVELDGVIIVLAIDFDRAEGVWRYQISGPSLDPTSLLRIDTRGAP